MIRLSDRLPVWKRFICPSRYIAFSVKDFLDERGDIIPRYSLVGNRSIINFRNVDLYRNSSNSDFDVGIYDPGFLEYFAKAWTKFENINIDVGDKTRFQFVRCTFDSKNDKLHLVTAHNNMSITKEGEYRDYEHKLSFGA